MGITFRCEFCHKEIQAPDTAGGKRGKCPFCAKSTYIPSPVKEEELLDLAPLDDQEEHRLQEHVQELYRREHDLIALGKKGTLEPLEERDNLTSADLHHFAVNYVLEMARNNLQGADVQVMKLRNFGALGVQAVDDFIEGNAHEPAMEALPKRVRASFLAELRAKLRP